ncbi:MAG: hypothetical protein K2X47_16445, partial [Bdellovibrionales bacterium]|nr:hypothetical protein [Bdellovibrionales bacterium]
PTRGPGESRLRSRSSACVLCHTNGLSRILPIPGMGLSSERARIKELNQVILSYKKPDLSHIVDLEKLGPPLGKKEGCVVCHGGALNPISVRQSLFMERDDSRIGSMTQLWFEMPPSFAKTRRIRDVLSLAESLSDEDVLKFRKDILTENLAELQRPRDGAAQKMSRIIQFRMMDLLEKNQRLSLSDRNLLMQELAQFEKSHGHWGVRLREDHLKSVADWLKEPVKPCLDPQK